MLYKKTGLLESISQLDFALINDPIKNPKSANHHLCRVHAIRMIYEVEV